MNIYELGLNQKFLILSLIYTTWGHAIIKSGIT